MAAIKTIPSISAVTADTAMDAACSPLTSQGPESFASDNEAVDYHQDESVRKCNKHGWLHCIKGHTRKTSREIHRCVSQCIHLFTGRNAQKGEVEQCCSSLHGNDGLRFVRNFQHRFINPTAGYI